MAWANSSFPVPLSPVIRTGNCLEAARPASIFVAVHGIYRSQKYSFTVKTHRYFRTWVVRGEITKIKLSRSILDGWMTVTMNRVVVKGQVDHGNML